MGEDGLRMVSRQTKNDASRILPGTWIKVNAASSKAEMSYRSKLMEKPL